MPAMNKRLQQRLIGAAVIIALAVIFLPMLLNGGGNSGPVSVKMKIPPEPSYSFNGAAQPPPASTSAPLQPVQVTPAQPIASQSSPASATQTAPAPSGNASTASAQSTSPPSPKMVEPKVTPPATPVHQAPPTPPAKPSAAPASQSGSVGKKSPSAPAPASSPTPAQNLATMSGKPVTSAWVVQVSALTVESSAKRLRDRLRKNGFAAYIDRFDDKGKVFYRVRVGPKLTRSGAETQRVKLEKTLKLKGIVVPYK